MCGQYEDTAYPRAWICEAKTQQRQQLAPDALLKAAIAAGSHSLAVSRWLFEPPTILQSRARPLGCNLVFRREVDGAQV